jgi:hypothetical protein
MQTAIFKGLLLRVHEISISDYIDGLPRIALFTRFLNYRKRSWQPGCKAEASMKVDFRRTGGFAPMPISCTLDTDTCSPQDARELERLIAAGKVMEAKSASIPGARDVRYYTIDIEGSEGTAHLKFDELSVPQNVRPLIEFLQLRAKPLFGDDD